MLFMKRFRVPVRAMIMAVPACISMISCKVSDPVYSEGGKDLIAYTSSLMIPLSLYEPAAVTAAAMDVDSYLSMSGEDREDAETMFPDGIEVNRDGSVEAKGIAYLQPGGTRFGETGSRWTVKRPYFDLFGEYPGYCSVPYYEMVWTAECTGDNEWRLSVEMQDGPVPEASEAEAVVRYGGKDGAAGIFYVTVSGKRTDGGYMAAGNTGESPAAVRRISVSGDSYGEVSYVMQVSQGSFHVDFSRDGVMLNYCRAVFGRDGADYSVGSYD